MNEAKSTRIVLISDQPIFMRGLIVLVSAMKDFRLVGEGCCAEEALQICQMTEPDLLVVDLKHLADERLDLIRQINQRWPKIRVIVLLGTQDVNVEVEEFAGQPLYFFSRDLNEDEFRAALSQVLQDAPMSGALQGVPQVNLARDAAAEQAEEQKFQRIAYRPAPSRSEELMARELVMAGKIQADILPEEPPIIRGWDIAGTLAPARETSGDFYDFIPLAPRKWGIVIADVSDKGMGAALLMALASTLFRTFAMRYPTLPAVTLSTISERILSDTRGGMFITSFLGVLEPHTGRLVFANAGHPPGFLVSLHRGKETIERLRPTGMALGVDELARWRQRDVRLVPGDFLVLYTDGITEAQNASGAFFGEERVLEAALSKAGSSAHEIQDAILAEVHRFTGSLPRQDDVALIVLRRIE